MLIDAYVQKANNLVVEIKATPNTPTLSVPRNATHFIVTKIIPGKLYSVPINEEHLAKNQALFTKAKFEINWDKVHLFKNMTPREKKLYYLERKTK